MVSIQHNFKVEYVWLVLAPIEDKKNMKLNVVMMISFWFATNYFHSLYDCTTLIIGSTCVCAFYISKIIINSNPLFGYYLVHHM